MNIFQLPNTLRLDGQLERQKGRAKSKPTMPFIFQNHLSSSLPITNAKILISFHLLPFQELFLSKEHSIITLSISTIDTTATIKFILKRCRLIEIEHSLKKDNEETQVRKTSSEAYSLNTLIFNSVEATVCCPFSIRAEQSIKCSVVAGDSKAEQSFKGLIKGLNIRFENSASISQSSVVVRADDKLVIPDISHPVQLTEFSLLKRPFTSVKPAHFIPKLPSGPKLLVCHDMMGGYVEDANDYSIISGRTNYRFNHFGIADIFIYFSHYNFTIPTKSWIDVCHNNNTVCLGTFIIERQIEYTSKDTADYLIYLAREHGFDGYLINIQYGVKDVPKFKMWLKYLVTEIHNRLPGSIVIWYDSIISTGQLAWQSQLNDKNAEFFEICDYFFTDYKWNVEKLQECWATAESLGRTSDVFIGNDIWGRGTFGGGKSQTYKAIKQISKLGLSVALFGQAYTYEDQAQKNPELFKIADDALFFGRKFIRQSIADNMWSLTKQGGNGWRKQGDDWVTSFDWCQRQWTCPINSAIRNQQTQITFTAQVKGTPPKTEDPFSITMESLIEGGFVVSRKTSGNGGDNFSSATDKWQPITLSVNFKELGNSASQMELVKITEVGKDAERWGGHFGVRFKNEQIMMSSYVPEMDLSAMVRKKTVTNLPYHSYFNVGQGYSYFWKGADQSPSTKSNSKGYDCLKDYDLPYQDKSISPELKGNQVQSSVNMLNGWIGGSSLKLKCIKKNQTFGVFKLLNLNVSGSEGLSVNIKVKQTTDAHKYTLICRHNNSEWLKCPGQTKKLSEEDWYQISFNIEPKTGVLTTLLLEMQLSFFEPVYLGELLVTKRSNPAIKPAQFKYSVQIRESPLKYSLVKKFIDVLVSNLSYDPTQAIQVLPESFVPLTKSCLVFINGYVRGSIQLNQPTSFFESIKVASFKDINVFIVAIDRIGNMSTVFASKSNTIQTPEYAWVRCNDS